jgi:serine/threonine protein phosphatase PrpC
MSMSLRIKRGLVRRPGRIGLPKLIESRQRFYEKRLIVDLGKDYLTAKKAFQKLLKKKSYFFPASILSASYKWNFMQSLLFVEFNKLKDKLPIDIISMGEVGSISKFGSKGVYGMTDIGMRKNNEDAVAVFEYKGKTYLLLADGMGGHQKGEIASHTAILSMMVSLEKAPDNLSGAIREAHQKVGKISVVEKKNRPGTTLSVAMVDGDSVKIAHVGDSPVYVLRSEGEIELLTYPHSGVGEWAKKLKSGILLSDLPGSCADLLLDTDLNKPPFPSSLISVFLAVKHWMLNGDIFVLRSVAHSITHSVGILIGNEIEVNSFKLNRGDKLLLSSDGLDLTQVAKDGYGLDEKMVQIMRQANSLQSRVDEFMQLVKRRQTSGADNTTMLFYEAQQ